MSLGSKRQTVGSSLCTEQNGYLERDIRTLKEASKTMLNNAKLPKYSWAEAFNCAIYTLNRVVSSSNMNKTRHQIWFKVKPSVRNLHTFGELAVLEKPDGNIQEWDHRGSPAIFVGYTDRFNTLRFFDKGKIVISCDVSFLNKMSENSKNRNPDETISSDTLVLG